MLGVTRQEQQLVLRLWKDWCRLWPEHFGHESLQVKPEGYDPVFDLIPSQTYKDFYIEVVRGHPKLKHLNAFEVVDAALNQVRAPEMPVVGSPLRAVEHDDATESSDDAEHIESADLPVQETTRPERRAERHTAERINGIEVFGEVVEVELAPPPEQDDETPDPKADIA